MSLAKKIKSDGESYKPFSMPDSLRKLKMCAQFGIDSATVRELHYFDLTAMLIDFQIDKFRELIAMQNAREKKNDGIERESVSGSRLKTIL